MIRKLGILAPLTVALGIAAPAQAVPLVQTFAIGVTDNAAPSTFGFLFGLPIAFAGPTQVTVTVIGAYADGGRDGASVTPTTAGQLVQVDLGGGIVAGAGAAASFAGAGGTAGDVLVQPLAVLDLGAPSTFGFLFGKPTGPATVPMVSQGAVGGGIVDGDLDGATITGQHPGGGLALFSVLAGVTTVGSYEVGLVPFDETAPFAADGSAEIPCSGASACDFLQSALSFDLTGGGDAAALVVRHEFGGDRIQGTVLETYGIASASGVFDCTTIGGCTFLTAQLNFDLSGGGDAAALAVRVELEALALPEPGALALFGLGLAGLGLLRRKRRG